MTPRTASKRPQKVAAIYVRVSSELQAEKASPAEQEKDCRAYARAKGYQVAEVYRDIERYRVKGRLVEPSGTRADRPGLLRMLADAQAGRFQVLVAWREDRLYRGLRPMLTVLEPVKAGTFDVELVKESFDRHMAGIKASIGEMELDGFRERTHLGVKARLAEGRLWGGQFRYGYRREGDLLMPHPEEAQVVVQVFEWFAAGVGVREIARRLIADHARQKEGRVQTVPWQLSFIYRILHCETYATGIHRVRRDGQMFDLPAPQLVDLALWQKAQAILAQSKKHPARNVKHQYLLSGLITCPCGASWHAYTQTGRRTWKDKTEGAKHEYVGTQSYYRCARVTASAERITHPDCPRSKGVVRLDQYVWGKVSDVLRQPDLLVRAAETRMAELRRQHADAAARKASLEAGLGALQMERMAYIRKFGEDSVRGGPFKEADFDAVLEALTAEEMAVRRDLADVEVVSRVQLADLEHLVATYLGDIQTAMGWLDREPANEAERSEQFAERRKVVTTLVERVTLRGSRPPEVTLRLNLSEAEPVYSLAS